MLVPNLSITRSGVGFPLDPQHHFRVGQFGVDRLAGVRDDGDLKHIESADPGTIDGYGPANTVFDFESARNSSSTPSAPTAGPTPATKTSASRPAHPPSTPA